VGQPRLLVLADALISTTILCFVIVMLLYSGPVYSVPWPVQMQLTWDSAELVCRRKLPLGCWMQWHPYFIHVLHIMLWHSVRLPAQRLLGVVVEQALECAFAIFNFDFRHASGLNKASDKLA